MPSEADRITTKKTLTIGILLLLSLSFFYPSLNSSFIYDDFTQILQNEKIKNINEPSGIIFNGLRQKRVIQNIGLALDWQISKGRPWSFHLQNIFWHGLCSFLVFLILIRFFPEQNFIPLAGTLLFTLHPLQHQSVVYIMGRVTLLQSFFYLATLALLLYHPRRFWWRNFFIWMALFAKESCILLPFFIGICDYLANPLKKKKFYWKPHLIAVLGVLLLSPILFIVLKDPSSMYRGVVGFNLYPFWEHLFTQGYYFLFYIFLFFNPSYQSIFHEMPLFDHRILILGALGLSLSIGISVYLWKTRHKNLSWIILWILLLFQLAPTNTILQMTNPFAEYRLYLGNLFLCVGTAFFLDRLLKKRVYGGILATIILTVYFLYFNYVHQKTWKHIFTTYHYALQLYPNSPNINYSIGTEYFVRQKFDEAEPFFLKALNIWKQRKTKGNHRIGATSMYLAYAYSLKGEYQKALKIIHPIVPKTIKNRFPKEYWTLKLFLYKKFKDNENYSRTFDWADQQYPGHFKK